jgi:signal transduction histidine kinase
MRVLGLGRDALLGASVGTAAALLGAWMAGPNLAHLPYTVLLVFAIVILGFVVGSNAAAWAFVAGTAILVVVALAPHGDANWAVSDGVRFVAFLAGAPLIVYLARRAEEQRDLAQEALSASHEAMRRADYERERLEDATLELDDALAAAERERSRLEEVAEAIPEPLIVYDDQLRGTYGNRAALRLFGRSFVERPLDDWGRAVEPRDEQGTPLARDDWPQVRAQHEPIRRRLTLRIPMSGRDVIVDTEGTPIPGGGAVLLLRDIGKEEDERRRLSRFASFVAHELRNPLAVAKARIELAQRDPRLSSRAGGHASRALESVDAAIGILERLELYSRADTGHVEARREEFELGPALAAATERLRTRGSEREVRVAGPDGVRVLGDRHLSEQAITNLLTNADRYSTPGGTIHVEVADGDQVTLRVRDEGPGIGDEIARTLFNDRVSAGRGLGLGLYLVQATMTAMGGSVQLEQRAPQAVFALRWARAPTSETPGTASRRGG